MDGLVHPRQVRAARALLGWTQSDLGRALGIDQRIVRFYEKGLPRNPKKIDALIRAFGTTGIRFVATPAIGVVLESDASRKCDALRH